MWYLIVSIPDHCTRTYFNTGVASAQDEKCSKAVLLLWIFYVFVLSCVCYVLCASVYMCFVVTSWLSFVVSSVSLSLSHWYPGSGVVLDCIDS